MFIHDDRDAVSVFQQIFNPPALTPGNGDASIAALDRAARGLLAVQHAAPCTEIGVAVGELFMAAQFGPDEAHLATARLATPTGLTRT